MKEERLEVRRRHGPTAIERLRWHVGTVAAVLAGLFLGLQIFGLVGAPSRHAIDAVGNVRAATARVREDVAKRRFPLEERVKAVDDEIGQLVTTFKHQPSPAENPPGLTYPAGYLNTLKPGESNEIRFDAPIDLVADAEAGGIDLKWGEAANNNVRVAAFEVFRREEGGEAAAIDKVDGSAHAFRDTKVQPGHVYEYTVRAVASDPDLANTPRGRSPQSAPATAKAIADFKIEIVDCSEGVAKFRVSKWFEGAWRDRIFSVHEGEAIGSMDQALGIDFGTGRRLAKLAIETSEAPVTREEIVFDPAGKVVLEAGIPKRVSISGVELRKKTVASISGGSLPDEVLEWEAPVRP